MYKSSAFCLPLFLIAFLFVSFFTSSGVQAAPPVPAAGLVGVSSAIVYDLDNEAIVFEQNADAPIPPASITKVLSMFLAFDHVKAGKAKMNSPVLISPQAAATGGSRMGLKPGETVTLKKLLLGMAVSSGNDASHAVAEFVGGNASNFVKMMNDKAEKVGMRHSSFLNPHGLPANGQYTTARDMLALSRAYLAAHPEALEMHNTHVLEHDGIRTWNKNPLLGQYPGADGLKSGWIRASGYNLIFTAKKGDRRLLAVILGAPDMYIRGAEACRLLDASFMACENTAPTVAAALDQLPVDLARIDPRKIGRDAGLLKARTAVAQKGRKLKYPRAKYNLAQNDKLRQFALSRNGQNSDVTKNASKGANKAVKAGKKSRVGKAVASSERKDVKSRAKTQGRSKTQAKGKTQNKNQRHASTSRKSASRG